eukprot:TCONS_00062224-protein
MEVLPGTGWDNLRNLDMSMVVWKNYSQCLTSDDGKYLLPDNIFVIALKKSSVELTSEYFDHFSDYTSSTSTSINAEAHASGFGIGVSGKFSSEFQHIKKSQVENKAVTTKVQLRHKFYTVKAQPGIQLHPNFKSRLLDIAAHLQSNNTRVAQYLADLIVRDFGTHYITSIDAGAILEKIDHVKSSYAKSQDTDRSKITASASASFPFGGVSTSASHAANKSNVAAYQNNVAGSSIHTHGGAPYRANFTTDQWEDSLADNLIAIDKAGDPLYFAITSETLPELPDMLAIQLSSIVEDSIKAYYKHNIVKGCTNPDSPSFNFAAILDDKSCDKLSKNFTFGGVYQVCNDNSDGFCHARYLQKNFKTDDFRCPEEYQDIAGHPTIKYDASCYQKCKDEKDVLNIWSDCISNCIFAYYQPHWCAYIGKTDDRGYLFGGLYNSISSNPLTGDKSCPPGFYGQLFGPEDMVICISDDYEYGSHYSIPFGGFFTCGTGNPMAMTNPSDYIDDWPKSCPQGYTQHLAVIDQGCEINYCIKGNSLSINGFANMKRPPFRSKPKVNMNITVPLTIINDNTGKIWLKNPKNQQWILVTKSFVLDRLAERGITDLAQIGIKNIAEDEIQNNAERKMSMSAIDILKRALVNESPANKKEAQISKSTGSSKGDSQPVSNGTAVGITIGVIAILLVIVLMVFAKCQRKKNQKRFTEIGAGGSNGPFNSMQTSHEYQAM